MYEEGRNFLMLAKAALATEEKNSQPPVATPEEDNGAFPLNFFALPLFTACPLPPPIKRHFYVKSAVVKSDDFAR